MGESPQILFPPTPRPATIEDHAHVTGPFFHGTRMQLAVGDRIVPGHGSNYEAGRVANNVYFATWIPTAAWGAELASALAGSPDRGYVYLVEPTGPFEDDPNVTDKRFPGNPTQSYRTRHALVVVRAVDDWEGHTPEQIQGMLEGLQRLREQGLDVIED